MAKITPADILNTAADAIKKYGWHQGAYGDENVGFCAIGAIAYAAAIKYRLFGVPRMDLVTEARICLQTALPEDTLGSPHIPLIVAWNDDASRTRRQVLAAFRRAAKSCAGS